MRREERQRSHCECKIRILPYLCSLRDKGSKLTFSFKSASETGLLGRVAMGAGGGGIEVSGIVMA